MNFINFFVVKVYKYKLTNTINMIKNEFIKYSKSL